MDSIGNIPVTLFVYRRPDKTQKVLEALARCHGAEETDVFVFSDGAKKGEEQKVSEVRSVLKHYKEQNYFNSFNVIESIDNRGLSKSIISGVNRILTEYEAVIVLEDDLIVNEFFLEYMKQALIYYSDDVEVGAVSGYSNNIRIPCWYRAKVFKILSGNSWGWGTWKTVWERVNWSDEYYRSLCQNKDERRAFDKTHYWISQMMDKQLHGEIDSWSVRFDYYLWKNRLYTIYPVKSFVKNIGFDEDATHCSDSKKTSSSKILGVDILLEKVSYSKAIQRRYARSEITRISVVKHRVASILGWL